MPPYKLRILRLPPSSLFIKGGKKSQLGEPPGEVIRAVTSKIELASHPLIMYEDECLVSIFSVLKSLRDKRGSN